MQTEATALTVEMNNQFGSHPWDCVTFHPVRLFRREGATPYCFQGRLHEQLVSQEGAGIPASEIEPSPLKLVHSGYLPHRIKAKRKAERNLNILMKMLMEAPDDPFTLYNLGVTYCQLGKPEEAVRLFASARTHAPLAAAYRPTLIRDSVKALSQLERWEEIVEILQIEACHYPGYPDLHHWLGKSLASTGRLMEAREAYSKAITCGKSGENYAMESGIGGFRTFYELGQIAGKLGSLDEASLCYEQCVLHEPLFEPGLAAWADTLDLLGASPKEIMERTAAAVMAKGPDGRLLLARVWTQIGLYTEALSLLKTVDSASLASQDVLRACLMQTGQYLDVLQMMDQEEGMDPSAFNLGAALDFALCFWSEDTALPYRFYRRLSESEQAAFESLDRYVIEGKKKEALASDPIVQSVMPELMERAVKRKLTRIADKLARISPEFDVLLGIALYRQGFVLPAADRLLSQMKEGRLTAEALYILGEIVYDKGHYSQAAGLFEQVLEKDGAHPSARIGVSLCYLHLAREMLLESLQKAPYHSAFQQDLKRTETSIRLLDASDWHTAWGAAERRNQDATPEDLFVHDR